MGSPTDWATELARRGMDEVRAELLATSEDVDAAAVAAALDAGCDPGLAWRIWNTEPPAPKKRRRRSQSSAEKRKKPPAS